MENTTVPRQWALQGVLCRWISTFYTTTWLYDKSYSTNCTVQDQIQRILAACVEAVGALCLPCCHLLCPHCLFIGQLKKAQTAQLPTAVSTHLSQSWLSAHQRIALIVRSCRCFIQMGHLPSLLQLYHCCANWQLHKLLTKRYSVPFIYYGRKL